MMCLDILKPHITNTIDLSLSCLQTSGLEPTASELHGMRM